MDQETGYTAMNLAYLLGIFEAPFGKGLVKHEKITIRAAGTDYTMVLVYVAPARQLDMLTLKPPGPIKQITEAQFRV